MDATVLLRCNPYVLRDERMTYHDWQGRFKARQDAMRAIEDAEWRAWLSRRRLHRLVWLTVGVALFAGALLGLGLGWRAW